MLQPLIAPSIHVNEYSPDSLDVSWLDELKMNHVLSDHNLIDDYLSSVEQTAIDLGQIQRFSAKDDQFFLDLHTELVSVLEKIEEKIVVVNSYPDDVLWKQNVSRKLEHLAIRIEDIAETCELATNHGFIKMIKAQVKNLMNGSAGG